MRRSFYNNQKSVAKRKEKLAIETKLDWLIPHVYAAIGLSLYSKYGWEPEQIQEMFTDSQELWFSSTREGWDILKNAEEIVGVPFERFKETGNVV
jgi:hypothetical protein